MNDKNMKMQQMDWQFLLVIRSSTSQAQNTAIPHTVGISQLWLWKMRQHLKPVFYQMSVFLSFVQSEVFDAIGMENTEADHAERSINNRTKFYQLNRSGEFIEVPYVDNSYKQAGGGFVGTTEDLCKFGQVHMKEGYLKQTTLDQWLK